MIHIVEIKFEGLDKVSQNLVKANFSMRDTGLVKLKDIEDGVEKLYGTRFFENVSYRIIPTSNGSRLVLRFKEQNSSYFKLSMHYDPYMQTAILFCRSYRNILFEGSHFLADIKIGQYPGLGLKYTLYRFSQPALGLTIKTTANKTLAKYYSTEGLLRGDFSNIHYTSEFDFFSSISKGFLLRSGLQWELFNIHNEIEYNDTINFNFQSYSWYSRLRFDTQNRTVFPTKGDNFYGEFKYIIHSRYFNRSGWDDHFWRLITNYTKFIPLSKKIVLITNINGGFSFSKKVPAPYYNYLGGFATGETNVFPFDGMKLMAVYSNYMVTSSLGLRVEPRKDKYITFKTNYAYISSDIDDLKRFKYKYFSTCVSLGIKTIVGPIEFSVSKSNNNNH